jgi:hypothetical protein
MWHECILFIVCFISFVMLIEEWDKKYYYKKVNIFYIENDWNKIRKIYESFDVIDI